MIKTISLHINLDLCQSCQRCNAAKSCRMKAIIQMDPGESPFLEVERCRGCWACMLACPHGAVQKLNREA